MQALVAVAPAVAGACILLDDDGRHAQAAQARTQRNAALAATDDEHIGLRGVAERRHLVLALLEPALAPGVHAVLGTLDAARALLLFKTLELDHGGQQGPGTVAGRRDLQAKMAAPARDLGLEGEPGIDDAIGFGGITLDAEVRWRRRGELRREHLFDRRLAFLGADVPGEGNQVAPVAIGIEQRAHGLGFAAGQSGLELGEPGTGPLGRCRHRCVSC